MDSLQYVEISVEELHNTCRRPCDTISIMSSLISSAYGRVIKNQIRRQTDWAMGGPSP